MDILQLPARNLGVTEHHSKLGALLWTPLGQVGRGGEEGKGTRRGTTEQWGAEHQLTNREQNHITTLNQWTPRHSDKTDGHRQDVRSLLRNKKRAKNPIK